MGTIDDAGFCNGLFDSEERSSGKAAGPGSGFGPGLSMKIKNYNLLSSVTVSGVIA